MNNIDYFKELLDDIEISYDDKIIQRFEKYKKMLTAWNKKINITSIDKDKDIYLKHFIDSIILKKYVIIKNKAKIIDVGTGGGFPSVPLKIMDNSMEVTLLDSLNKRIKFLEEVIKELDLDNTIAIHKRAEDIGQDKNHREKYDYCFSRAVASLNVLLEYTLPLVKKDSLFIAFKGSNYDEEIKFSKKALNTLGGEIIDIKKYKLPKSDFSRSLIIIKKIKNTPKNYPRKAGTPNKKPL